MTDFLMSELAGICRQKLDDDGFSIRAVEDFKAVREVVKVLGKPYLTPKLSPFMNDFTPNNCFWLLLERGDQTLAAGGCRLDDLGDMKLSQFWMNCVERHYYREGGNCARLSRVAAPVDEALRGKLAYFGDLIVDRNAGTGIPVLRRFTHFAQAFAMLKFRPDFSYAFVREKDAGRGAMGQFGFNTIIHNAQTWIDPPGYHRDDDACLYVSRSYFGHYARVRCNSPEKL